MELIKDLGTRLINGKNNRKYWTNYYQTIINKKGL